MGFLSALGDLGGQMSPLINILSSLNGMRNVNGAINRNNVATPAERSSQAIYAALADPNSPILKNMTDTQDATNLNNFQRQITEMQLADRRAQSMGRSPTFFSPERADETVNYLTTRGLPQLHQAAQDTAMQRLIEAAGGQAGAMGPQAARQQVSGYQGISNAVTNTGYPAQIIAALQGKDPNSIQNPMMGFMNQSPMLNNTYNQNTTSSNQMRYQ